MNILERFERFITKKDDGCWVWHGALRGGYGAFSMEGKLKQSHRVAYELYNKRPITEGYCIRHKCRNTSCVNPDHIEEGTLAQNQADRIRDGTDCRGEKHPNCKLTAEQVRAIRASTDKVCVLADKYNVNNSSISNIRTGRKWGWLV
jgi:hypothetical protein